MAVKRVLLVDYDPKSLTHTRTLLQGAGFDVSTCGDGLSAIDQFKSEAPDLVLLSAMLPKMHGFEVCSNIRKLPGGENTPVVIITDVYKGKRYRTDAIQKYGATEYIEKPIEDSNLVSILQGLVKSNGAVAPSTEPAGSLDEKTVQFSRDALFGKLAEEGVPKPAGEKKTVSEKPKSKDEMERKLEQSLAGLDLTGRSKPKPKPASPPTAAVAKPAATSVAPESTATVVIRKDSDSAPGSQFTSEDLFTDVIASVERELQSEKLITNPGVQTSPAPEPPPPPPVAAAPPAPAPAPVKPAEPPKAPEHAKAAEPAKKGFDSDMEKKLSNTLSGLRKEKQPAQSKTVSIPTPKAEPSKPAPAAKAEHVQPAAKPEPPAESPATVMMTKEKVQDAVAATDGINFGQYLLLSKIATGGMAELFKAKRKGVEGFEKILAIKRILPHMSDNEEFITMFIDEAKLAAQLSHHNICQIFDLGKIQDSYYIAMEYVHGKDLRAVLKAARSKSKPVPVELAVLITSKICSALDYAHRKRDANGQPLNLVHRDVSPQNILISYEGDVKLVDFGIAKAATKVHVTQHGALKGKLLYMSPEQAWGRSVDRRSDIFSVAVVLYEMLTGRPLFFEDNDTEVTILEKVREARIVPIRDINATVSQDLEKIILKGLHKKSEERYQVASEMQKDLDNLFYTEGFNATSASLATFARSLFPEEWGLESGSKDTVMIDKEGSEAMKAALPAAAAAARQAVVAAASAAAAPPPAAPAPAPAPQPAPAPVAAKPAPQPAPEPVAARPQPEPPQHKAPAPHAQPQPKPADPAPSASGFRDISMPEIIPSQPEKSNTMKIAAGIIALVIAVGVIAFFLFRSPAQQTQQAEQPKPAPTTTTTTTQPAPAPTPAPEATTPAPTPQEPVPATTTTDTAAADKLKQDLEKKIEEERLKLEKIKADDAARKVEEDRKKAAELAKLQEQQKAQQKAAEPEPKVEPPPAQEQPVVAQPIPVQPEPDPVPEPAKPEPDPVPAAPQVNEGDLVEMTPDVMKPSIVSRVEPSYPPVARSKKVEGTVILSVLIAETGNVADVKVLREAGGSMGLNEAAIAAVKKWKFRPAVKAGKRVKVWVTYPIVFKVQ